MKKVLVQVPNNPLEVMASLSSVKINSKFFPETLVFDFEVSGDPAKTLVENSFLAHRIYDPGTTLHNQYHLVHTVSPNKESGETYSKQEYYNRLEEARKILGHLPDWEYIPDTFSVFATEVLDLSLSLKKLFPKYDLWNYIQSPNVSIKPFINIKSIHKKEVEKKLRNMVGSNGLRIQNRTFLVFFADDEDLFYRLASRVEFPSLIVLEDGSVYNTDTKLSLMEQLALVSKDSCIFVGGAGWRVYSGWVFEKPLVFQVVDGKFDGRWEGIKYNKAVSWNKDEVRTEDILKTFRDMVMFHIKNF